MRTKSFLSLSTLLLVGVWLQAQETPAVYSGISQTDSGLVYDHEGEPWQQVTNGKHYHLKDFVNAPKSHRDGIAFDFNDPGFRGRIYYGFINIDDEAYPIPVYFKKSARIAGGNALVPLIKMTGKYDMVNWEGKNRGLLGYRVTDENGTLIYDGRVHFTYDGEFVVEPTIVEGPTLHKVTANTATVRIVLSKEAEVELYINKSIVRSPKGTVHEFDVKGLQPSTTYRYEIQGFKSRTYTLKTNPEKGDQSPFVFAYASDSRNGNGGGERNVYGANAYIVNRIMALNKLKGAAFMQFSGDLIDGYLTDPDEMNLQYANWKRSLEPFSHYMPVYVGMGNHEALLHAFKGEERFVTVDKFPFADSSAEAVFQANFCNPLSELKSEDGNKYDPDPNAQNFPNYDETVFSYNYGNVEMIVLNSNYWYAPQAASIPEIGGNIHAYIMDNQLEWLRKKIADLEGDKAIQHVFVTLHTPFFPNGGHVKDDMWYKGNNDPRPYIAGKAVDKGIIERRDELLDLLINKSTKVRAILTGDEHNYAKTEISQAMPKYPMDWRKEKLDFKRTIWQINNGSAGAPYYSQEETPWSQFATNFSTQNVNVFIYVEGKKVRMEVINPLTFELVDELKITGY